MFWEGTILRKWAFELVEGAIVILELFPDTSGTPKRFTSYWPLTTPATILWVWLGNWIARAPCCLLAITPSVSISKGLPSPLIDHFFFYLLKAARALCCNSWDERAGLASSRSIWTGFSSWRDDQELGKSAYPPVGLSARFLRIRCKGMVS